MAIRTTRKEFRKLIREEYVRYLQELADAPVSAADQEQIDDAGRDIAKALIQAVASYPHLPSDQLLAAAIEDAQQLVSRRNKN